MNSIEQLEKLLKTEVLVQVNEEIKTMLCRFKVYPLSQCKGSQLFEISKSFSHKFR